MEGQNFLSEKRSRINLSAGMAKAVIPVESVASVLRNLRNFNGRARRSEFWWFFIIALIVGLALMSRFFWFASWYFSADEPLFLLLSVALLLPVLYLIIIPAVTVRRLHDTGRSARWLLICVGIVAGWGIIVGAVVSVASTSDDGWGAAILALFLGGLWVLVSLLGLAVLTKLKPR